MKYCFETKIVTYEQNSTEQACLTIKQQYESINQSILNSSFRSAREKSSSPSRRLRKPDKDTRAMPLVNPNHKASVGRFRSFPGRRWQSETKSGAEECEWRWHVICTGYLPEWSDQCAEESSRGAKGVRPFVGVPVGGSHPTSAASHKRPSRTTWPWPVSLT